MPDIVLEEVNKLIEKILTNIRTNHINIEKLCDELYLTEEKFIDIIRNPRKNISLYLEILDVIDNMREVPNECC